MNQNDQSNTSNDNLLIGHSDDSVEKTAEAHRLHHRREWLPEDDDDWYEPDYPRRDRN